MFPFPYITMFFPSYWSFYVWKFTTKHKWHLLWSYIPTKLLYIFLPSLIVQLYESDSFWKRCITNDTSSCVLSSTHWYLTCLPWLHRKVFFLWTLVTFILPNVIFNSLFSFYLTCRKHSARLTSCFICSLALVFVTQSWFLLSHLLLRLSSWLVSVPVVVL